MNNIWKNEARVINMSGAVPTPPVYWNPVLICKKTIEDEILRLCDMARPDDGHRSSFIVHPNAARNSLALAPGIDVAIKVLLPGEQTAPMRRNSNQVEICIGGSGHVNVAGREIRFSERDVWNIPSMQTYYHRNDGPTRMVRLSYSNAPLLEMMTVHYVEKNPAPVTHELIMDFAGTNEQQRRARETAPSILLSDDGAWLRSYEFIVDIEVIESKSLIWRWQEVAPHLRLSLGGNQRPIMLLYNPATERRAGTTHSFFATIAAMPAGSPARPIGRGHRHSSAAINYTIEGRGISIVEGETIEWGPGDLLLSAPGWAEHAHYPSPSEQMIILTIQDHPLQIGMESLIWQESMNGPIFALGSEKGVTGYTSPREQG